MSQNILLYLQLLSYRLLICSTERQYWGIHHYICTLKMEDVCDTDTYLYGLQHNVTSRPTAQRWSSAIYVQALHITLTQLNQQYVFIWLGWTTILPTTHMSSKSRVFFIFKISDVGLTIFRRDSWAHYSILHQIMINHKITCFAMQLQW